MKLTKQELIIIREGLTSGIELRKAASYRDLKEGGLTSGHIQTCIDVDNQIIKQMEKLHTRINKAIMK